jgi:DinB family protein
MKNGSVVGVPGMIPFSYAMTGEPKMNLVFFSDRLSTNREVFEGLLKGVDVMQARWKPSPDKWSTLEVINHLYDEEREDFRARIESVLADPHRPWPPIDPQNWVVNRGYNERELDTSLQNFLSERQKSLLWLKELSTPDWDSRYAHPDGRSLSAGDLLASWLAHDFLHLRQLARLHWQYVGAVADPYQTTYGGPWKES